MRWDRSHQSRDIEDRRSSSGFGGGGLPLGTLLAVGSRFGWKGILVAIVIVGALAYGGMCTSSSLCGGGASDEVSEQQKAGAPAPTDELPRFVGFVLDDVQDFWSKRLRNYERSKLVLFRGSIGSACGGATSAVGPFYCPNDHKVYIDLAFYDDLRRQFGAPGDFAQAYVIAHEIGHHVQNLRGVIGREDKIAVELQADCLAGAWSGDAERRGLLEIGDVDEALNAASQIGDDTIQRRTQGRVQPETWTHGSAAQRSAAFKRGFEGGPEACGI